MNTEPKPATGEWTVSPIGEILHNGECMATAFTYVQGKACVDAIKAALAAEREKVQPLVERLEQLRCYTNVDGNMLIDDVLAQLKERP